jgi:LysM repeat protein
MRTFLLLTLVISYINAEAQSKDLLLSSDKRKSIQYKVGPKETLFSLGRKFYVHPRFLASFNKISYDKGLQLGQSLLIPLTDTNFSATSSKGLPVYRASKNQKKLLAGRLVKNEQLQLSELSKATVAEASQEELSQDLADAVKDSTEDEIAVAPPKEIPLRAVPVTDTIVTAEEAGHFKYAYEEQMLALGALKQTVKAGIFKTTSGWKDRKYYLLTNSAVPGSYVQLYAPSTQKTVYAKVLGEMSGIRQNEGYDIRISNAAAAVLGVGELSVFELEMSYTPVLKR